MKKANSAVFLWLACAASAWPATTANVDRIQADVARLASDKWAGRRAGTTGADQASEWLASEFRRIGLAPAGEKGGYFQTFTFIDGVVLGSRNRLSVGARSDWKPGIDFRPLSFSSPGQVAGEVVFAGYGIVAKDLQHDDYEGIDVKGRIVLLLRYGPDGDDTQSKWAAFTALRHKVSTARDRGAAAVLIVSGPRTKNVPDALVPLRADASLADAGIPALSITRRVAEAILNGSGETLDAIHEKLDSPHKTGPFVIPAARVEVVADLTPKRATSRNVVGLLSAPAATEAVVAGAHYDHLGLGASGSLDPKPDGKIHHGADDNASGVAGLLELARRLETRGASLRRSVYFVGFGAEELGTLGSSHFVKQPPQPLERVAAMFNMDMIGRLREDALDVHGTGTSPVWGPLIEAANRDLGLKLKLHEGGYGPSDHSPFYAAGRPVFFVFTGNHSEYHRPSDTASTINAAGIAKVVSLVEGVLVGVASSRDTVAFTRVAAEKERQAGAARGFRVWVGGVPDYSEEGPGVKFSGVSPGSPGEKAGLRAGDVLVKFGEKLIRNIYDYTYALGEHKPGDTVVLVVKRGGQEVALEVTLGSRPGGQ